MLIRMLSGITTAGPVFQVGDYVDWKPDEVAERLCERNLADPIKKLPEGIAPKEYTEPAPRPVQKPAPVKVKRRDMAEITE